MGSLPHTPAGPHCMGQISLLDNPPGRREKEVETGKRWARHKLVWDTLSDGMNWQVKLTPHCLPLLLSVGCKTMYEGTNQDSYESLHDHSISSSKWLVRYKEACIWEYFSLSKKTHKQGQGLMDLLSNRRVMSCGGWQEAVSLGTLGRIVSEVALGTGLKGPAGCF